MKLSELTERLLKTGTLYNKKVHVILKHCPQCTLHDKLTTTNTETITGLKFVQRTEVMNN